MTEIALVARRLIPDHPQDADVTESRADLAGIADGAVQGLLDMQNVFLMQSRLSRSDRPFANGRVTKRNRDRGFAARHRVLSDLAAHFGVTVDAEALAALLVRPWSDAALSGAATVTQLKSNLQALEVARDRQTEFEMHRLAEAPET